MDLKGIITLTKNEDFYIRKERVVNHTIYSQKQDGFEMNNNTQQYRKIFIYVK